MRTSIYFSTIIMLLAFPLAGMAATINVPGDYLTIQEAIDASANNDVVLVAPGIYLENINFNGKAILVKSAVGPEVTTISGNQSDSVVLFISGEGQDSIIDGFTITNGSGHEFVGHHGANYYGGGVYCEGTDPIIRNNTIVFNFADYGGGVATNDGNPLITNNVVNDNSSLNGAGGLWLGSQSPAVINNTISANTSLRGGGIYGHASDPMIANNMIRGNNGIDSGGGLRFFNLSAPTLVNNTIVENTSDAGGGINLLGCPNVVCANTIFWNNTSADGPAGVLDDFMGYSSSIAISYSDVSGGQAAFSVYGSSTLNWGAGMIDSDPLFADAANGDYHLTRNSPCRDTGNNSAVTEADDFEGDSRIALYTVDMGADEYYYHLYHSGEVVPGGSIDIKIVGYEGAPVTLALGSGIVDPPVSTQHGDLYLPWPPLWQGMIGTVPSSGVLTFSVTVPTGWICNEQHPLQALIGPRGGAFTQLSNLMLLTVE